MLPSFKDGVVLEVEDRESEEEVEGVRVSPPFPPPPPPDALPSKVGEKRPLGEVVRVGVVVEDLDGWTGVRVAPPTPLPLALPPLTLALPVSVPLPLPLPVGTPTVGDKEVVRVPRLL